MSTFQPLTLLRLVAPRAGAWIEITMRLAISFDTKSPLAQGRGLKLRFLFGFFPCLASPLAQGRGLKFKNHLLL